MINYPVMPSKFDNENEVQFYYSSIISQILNCAFKVLYRSDGVYENENIKILAEYKCHVSFHNKIELSKCILQSIAYLKRFENDGVIIPKAIFLGNSTRFCIFSSNDIEKYFYYNEIDWLSRNPRSFYENPPEELLKNISEEFNTHIYDINNANLIKGLTSNFKQYNGIKIMINSNNILRLFEEFITSNIVVDKLNEHQMILLFASILFGECSDLVKDENRIATPIQDKQLVKINRPNYNSFLNIIKEVDNVQTKDEIIAQSDRLINEVFRRYHGEFYTPKKWVDEAHKMIVDKFGPDCYNEYIWWDPCCGTGNLTRDYIFKELYCSTLYQSDIDIMNQRNYNPEAVKFQYDFLNDDIYPDGALAGFEVEEKIEKEAPGLVQAFKENKKIIIFMNPPYGQSSGYNFKKNTNTFIDKVKKIPLKDIYTKFIYRVMYLKDKYNSKNINICLYSPSTLFSSIQLRDFRQYFLNEFNYECSFMFSSKSFSDISNPWPISFTIFSPDESKEKFDFQTKVYDENVTFWKNVYNLDSNKNTLKENILKIDKEKDKKTILMKGPKKLFSGDFDISLMPQTSLGYATIGYNKDDSLHVNIFNTISSVTGGIFIYPENLFSILISFMCQRCVLPKKFHEKTDEFINISIDQIDKQILYDSIVYSLFNNRSYQFSFRNQEANVKNEFFWMSNSDIIDLSNSSNFTELYRDSKLFTGDSFIYTKLVEVSSYLSDDSKNIIKKANDLVIKSIDERKKLHILHPEWNLNTWDAGWYQIKLILNASFKNELSDFDRIYKSFEERLKNEIYKFGFLK